MNTEKWGRQPFVKSKDPYQCGISGTTYSPKQVTQRVDFLSRAIAKRLGFQLNEGTEWDKVVGLFSMNTVSGPLSSAAN